MHIFITAEIGINHNGDLKLAKELIDIAVVAGCDAVKFQKRTVDKVYSKEYLQPVNDLMMNLEFMMAVQTLSRITGLDMTAAEKVIRHWDRYWY